MKNVKKIVSGLMATIMSISVTSSVFAALPSYGEEYQNQSTASYSQKFKDVDKSYWAFNYIGEMANRGVIDGYPNDYYYPDNNVSRAEFAKIMSVAAGLVVNNSIGDIIDVYGRCCGYEDVSAEWFAPYVAAARYYLSGYSNNGAMYYLPGNNALREDIAVALVKLKGYDTSLYDESMLKAMFTDWQSISSGARKYVAIAVENGLISGYDDNTFRGQNGVTRAEAATLLWRAYQYGNGNKVFEPEVIETAAPVVKPTTAPIQTYEPEETEEPYVEPTEEPTQAPTPEPTPAYSYQLTSIANHVDSLDTIITDGEGTIYWGDENKVYTIKKDGNDSELFFDSESLGFIDGKEHSKAEKPNNKIEYIGYNKNDCNLYCIISIGSYHPNYYLYNMTCNKKLSKIENNTSLELHSRYKRLIFMPDNSVYICVEPDSGTSYMVKINSNYEAVVVMSDFLGEAMNINNTLIGLDDIYSNKFYKFNTKNDSSERIVFSGMPFAANNSAIYVKNDDCIYTVDLDGNDTLIMCEDDIDNKDARTVDFSKLSLKRTAVDNDGTIYYYDSNYNAIRQIKKIK